MKRIVFAAATSASIAAGAKLYSFWTGGADGRSGGYLAGGSPESATLRDERGKGDSRN